METAAALRHAEFPLRGGGGEPVDVWRTITSHGLNFLPPASVDREARVLEITLPLSRARPRTVRVRAGRAGFGVVEGRAGVERVVPVVEHILRLDEDLSEFYALAAEDVELAWAASGAGRMMRSATVFEDVVKTICTTNCAWSGTVRMVTALVDYLGEPAPGGRRAFPSAEAMASADISFYRDVARAGYRGAYLRSLAESVADGRLDLEALARDRDRPDDEVAARLLELPGVGPYAAAHIMMLIGRYSRLVLDSWTRPTYARLVGKKKVADKAIERRFRRYGPYAGVAFWVYLTREWVTDDFVAQSH